MENTDIAALEKEFASAALDDPCISRGFRLSLWVPTDCMGKVIGSKGAVIQHIQRESQTRMVSLPALRETLWSPLAITGAPGSVLQAYLLVAKIVEEQDDVVAEFHCPFLSLRSRAYGPHGAFTRKLSADHAVRVFIPDYREAGRDGRDSLMSIEGSITAVWRALGDIVALFSSEDIVKQLGDLSFSGKGSSWRRGAAESPQGAVDVAEIVPQEVPDRRFEHSYAYTVSVPAAVVGVLLSTRTSSINFVARVAKSTGTYISSKKCGDKDQDLTDMAFTVAGKNSHNVALASSFLVRVVRGDRIGEVLESVQLCQPQRVGSDKPSRAKSKAGDEATPKENGRTKPSKQQHVVKPDPSSTKGKNLSEAPGAAAVDEGGPERDEEEINEQLFSAPDASAGEPSRRTRSGRRGGRGSKERGGKTAK